MNTQTQEALKMAIEALDTLMIEKGSIYQKALEACKEALEQPSVAELNDEYLRDTYVQGLSQPAQEPVEYLGALATMDGSVNLYYKKLSWQELSGDDMHKIIVKYVSVDCTCDPYEFARAIEQALKEKNNG